MSPIRKAMKKLFFPVFDWIYIKLLTILYSAVPKRVPTIKNSVLLESASSIAVRIRTQKVTSVEVVRSHINRIEEINDILNCVVDERFEQALTEAENADKFIRCGKKTPEELEKEKPFLGVPFTVPEAVAVKGLSNTMGLLRKRDLRADVDADVVALMKEGGAIVLAVTNVSEACFTRETINPVFGRTVNPYDTNRSVGGPFGGEACLIASSGSPLGVASSVTLPSAFNGVFGHEPSANACSAGVISRSSIDLIPALKLLTKNSNVDLKLDEQVDVRTLKYYYVEEDVEEVVADAIKKAVDHLRNYRKASIRRVDLKKMKGLSIPSGRCLGEIPYKDGKVNLRKELVKVLFGKSQHSLIFLLTALTKDEVRPSDTQNKDLKQFQDLLGEDGVLICPTQPTSAFRHNGSIARLENPYANAFDVLGLPSTHCPAGLDSDGLPVGFQLVAGKYNDRLTLAVAREMEKVFGGWKPPPTHGCFTLKNTVFHNSYNEKVKTL